MTIMMMMIREVFLAQIGHQYNIGMGSHQLDLLSGSEEAEIEITDMRNTLGRISRNTDYRFEKYTWQN